MTCPRCSAGIRASRRYCGKCGCNLAPACQACGFANEQDDRFCGGCGVGLVAGAAAAHAAPAAQLPATTVSIPSNSTWGADELAVLFARPAVSDEGAQLPESGVAQDDLDRLFGGAP